MIQNVLTSRDYVEIIEHCASAKNNFAVRDFIADLIVQSRRYNTNIEIALMERLEKKYPKLFDGLITPIDLIPDEPVENGLQDRMEFLYGYLIKCIQIKEFTKGSNKIYLHDCIAQSKRSKLPYILKDLKSKGFCTFSSVKNIAWIFEKSTTSAEAQVDEKSERIRWVDKASKSKGANYRTLLLFLKEIAPDLFTGKSNLNKIVCNDFLGLDGKQFKYTNLKRIITSFKGRRKSETINTPRAKLLFDILQKY